MQGAIDVNSRSTITALLKTDASTIERLTANSATGALTTTINTSGAVTPKHYAETDDNDRPTIFAVSEDDRVTPIALQCDSTGALLIKVI